MKVGSLVVCVDASNIVRNKPLIQDKIYTIRGFYKNKAIYLEEVVNDVHPFYMMEYCYKIERFRELYTPTEISLENILKNELV